MARIRNVTTGVTASVNDETLERLGSDWEPADDETKKARASRTRKES